MIKWTELNAQAQDALRRLAGGASHIDFEVASDGRANVPDGYDDLVRSGLASLTLRGGKTQSYALSKKGLSLLDDARSAGDNRTSLVQLHSLHTQV